MALPSVSLNTPIDSVFDTEFPSLDFTGSESDSNDLSYKILITTKLYKTITDVLPSPNVGSPNIVFFNGIFVLFSQSTSSGRYYGYTSPDGENWTRNMDMAGENYINNLLGLEETNGVLYAYGYSGLWRSIDGVNWEKVYASNVAAIAYGNGIYVAASRVIGSCLTSTDGVTWTTRTTVEGKRQDKVTFANGEFYSLSGYDALRSIDGINWELTASPPYNFGQHNSLYSIGDRIFVSLGVGYANQFQTSTDNGLTFQTMFTSGGAVGSLGYVRPVGDGAVVVVYPGAMLLQYPPYRYDGNPRGPGSTVFALNPGSYGSSLASPAVAIGNGVIVVVPDVTGYRNIYVKTYHSYSSDADLGFSNLSNPADTDPFNAGDQVRYIFQNNLRSGEYEWRVMAVAPEGEGVYGNWSIARDFSVVRPPNPGIFMQFLT